MFGLSFAATTWPQKSVQSALVTLSFGLLVPRREYGNMVYRAYIWILFPYSLLGTSKSAVELGVWVSGY